MACRVLKENDYIVTQAYKSTTHKGIDIVSGTGGKDYIIAHTSGVVTFHQLGIPNDTTATGNRSYGNCVKILHSNGYYTLYAHMAYIHVEKGDVVTTGQVIGYMGNSGNSTGAHLHFEVRDPTDTRIDPTSYLSKNLPTVSTSTSSSSSTSYDITQSQIITVLGEMSSVKTNNLANSTSISEGCEILFENDVGIYLPVVVNDVTLEYYKSGRASALRFSCVIDDVLNITEGNAVSLRFDGEEMFYGYVFERTESDPHIISILCYDQLRYFKNETCIMYEDKKYSEVLNEIAVANNLIVGEIDDTGYDLNAAIEQGTIFDILENASSETTLNSGEEFILYDDFGEITLKSNTSMFVPIMIDETNIESYEYTTSIDQDVYTKVTITRENSDTGILEYYTANNEETQAKWGILEYYDSDNSSEVAQIKENVTEILSEYSERKTSLFIKTVLGDTRIRGGSSFVVSLKLNDETVYHVMQVQSVKHVFDGNSHSMELDLTSMRTWEE